MLIKFPSARKTNKRLNDLAVLQFEHFCDQIRKHLKTTDERHLILRYNKGNIPTNQLENVQNELEQLGYIVSMTVDDCSERILLEITIPE